MNIQKCGIYIAEIASINIYSHAPFSFLVLSPKGNHSFDG